MNNSNPVNIPTHEEMYPHILKVMDDGQVRSVRQIREDVTALCHFTEEQLAERVSSGGSKVHDRISWGVTYLHRGGMLERVKRAHYVITPIAIEKFRSRVYQINNDDLMEFPNFRAFISPKSHLVEQETSTAQMNDVDETTTDVDDMTPEEGIDEQFRLLNKSLKAEILDEIAQMSPRFFEKLVLDLLYAMGYGSRTSSDPIIRTPYVQDDGIDGTIKEDELGLNHIYVQAKRWAQDSTVGQPDIQRFVGALSGQNANKGIFITTSSFSKHAINYAKNLGTFTVILIDGDELTDLMIAFEVGLTTEKEYKVQRIDLDYFLEE